MGHPLSEVLAGQDRTARWLSIKCGFDPSYAYKVIAGLRRPSPAFRAKASELLGVPESLLFPDTPVTPGRAA